MALEFCKSALEIVRRISSLPHRNFIRVLVLFVFLFGHLPQGLSKDLSLLTRILYAAFLAEQMSAVCTQWISSLAAEDRASLAEDRARFEDAKLYSQSMKQKVATGLSDAEVDVVLKSAADRAVAESRQAIRMLHSYGAEHEAAELLRWCRRTVKPFAEEVVGTYARQRNIVDQLIEKAKAD